MSDLVRTTICLDRADYELAKAKGLELSRIIREILHSVVTNEQNTTQDIETAKKEIDKETIKKAEAEQNINLLKVRIAQLETALTAQKEAEKTKTEASKKLLASCLQCKEPISSNDNFQMKIKTGKNVGRRVCGHCVEVFYLEKKKEWNGEN